MITPIIRNMLSAVRPRISRKVQKIKLSHNAIKNAPPQAERRSAKLLKVFGSTIVPPISIIAWMVYLNEISGWYNAPDFSEV